MATHEGWTPAGFPGNPNGSQSFRNHNPGNLRSSPFQCSTSNGFAVFKNDSIGWFAFENDIKAKAKGNTLTGLNGESTLRQLIFVWAPPSDNNDSETYLKTICFMTGFAETMKLKELLD